MVPCCSSTTPGWSRRHGEDGDDGDGDGDDGDGDDGDGDDNGGLNSDGCVIFAKAQKLEDICKMCT